MQRGFEVKEYFNIIARRRWHFITPMIIVISLSTVFTLMLPKIYYSQANILVETRGTNPTKEIFQTQGLDSKRLQIMKETILSRPKIEEVIKKLGLEQNVAGPEEYEKLVKMITVGIQITGTGRKISIGFRGTDPRMVMQIVNTLCGFFVDQDINLIFGEKESSTIHVIKDLLNYYEHRVNSARAVLEKFKIEHTGQLLSSQNKNFQAIESAQLELAEIEVAVKEETEKKRLLEKRLAGDEADLPDFDFVQEKLTPEEKQLHKLKEERDALLARYTKKHPEIIRIKSKIETLKQRILTSYRTEGADPYAEEEVNVQQISLSPQYLKFRKFLDETNQLIKRHKERSVELTEKIQQLNESVRRAPTNQQEFAALQRDLSVNDKIYGSLLAKVKRAQLAREIDAMEKSSRFAILNPAQLPLKPVAPNMSKNLIIATVIGILIGTSIALLAEINDHSLRNLADAKQFLTIPILSTIPTVNTTEEIIRKRRTNMLMTVMGTFYGFFVIMLIARELILIYAPQLLYLQTYKELFYQLSSLL